MEVQYYTARPENLSTTTQENISLLNITARREYYGGFYFTSARIKTQDLFSFTFGRAEARIRLPVGQGIWPAFWLLGDAIGTVGWPQCGEIDILELKGGISDNRVEGTIHWATDPGGAHHYAPPGGLTLESGTFADDYHVFGIEWNAHSLTWYLDDTAFHRVSLTEADKSELRNGPFFLLLNVAVGGNYLAGQVPPSDFSSAVMNVDWVRVYQRP